MGNDISVMVGQFKAVTLWALRHFQAKSTPEEMAQTIFDSPAFEDLCTEIVCPIGIAKENSQFCSAGSCVTCAWQRASYYKAKADAAEEALKPFAAVVTEAEVSAGHFKEDHRARIADDKPFMTVADSAFTWGDLRRAHDVLNPKKEREGPQ